ncbi:MAG TPA: triose-phosphate isomerase [Candidatus Limnocylindria bacterium]|nr:triose-phosphate isomerase [Candidatus Limnocylindria bacterium]
MRRPLIAGNWKMNPGSHADARALAEAVADAAAATPGVEVVACPPTVWLEPLSRALGGRLTLGAQTMHWEDRGPFTGETSPLMLAGLAEYVIIGHSERREHDAETDEKVARKVASAVHHGLAPIAAIGERHEERRAGTTHAVIEHQARIAIGLLPAIVGSGLVLAYEPVWAIGTGEAATPSDAQAAAAAIREILREADPACADDTRILYGGSVTAENAGELIGQPDVDGALVGGASLDPIGFAGIIRAAAAQAA